MKDDSVTIEDIHTVIGLVVPGLLENGEVLQVHEIINALFNMSAECGERKMQNACLAAIRFLSAQMH